MDECIDFITDIDERTFMVVSEEFNQIISSIAPDIPQVSRVYIFCKNDFRRKSWLRKHSEMFDIFTDITSIREELKLATHHCDHNSVSLSFVKKTDAVIDQSLDILDCSFMYTQILKEILLTIDFDQRHINEFVTYCRARFASNNAEVRSIHKIEEEYHHHQPIWWYTSNSTAGTDVQSRSPFTVVKVCLIQILTKR